MIPLTKEAREGLTKMVSVADCGEPALRDPKVTAAMAWIESLPADIGIDAWKVYLGKDLGGCTSCPFETQIVTGLCGLALYLGDGERACQYDEAPEWCRLRSGGVLVVGAMP
jgi:hypothetical protein